MNELEVNRHLPLVEVIQKRIDAWARDYGLELEDDYLDEGDLEGLTEDQLSCLWSVPEDVFSNQTETVAKDEFRFTTARPIYPGFLEGAFCYFLGTKPAKEVGNIFVEFTVECATCLGKEAPEMYDCPDCTGGGYLYELNSGYFELVEA